MHNLHLSSCVLVLQNERQKNLNETMLNAAQAQSNAQQTLHNEFQVQRERISRLGSADTAKNAGVTQIFQRTVRSLRLVKMFWICEHTLIKAINSCEMRW